MSKGAAQGKVCQTDKCSAHNDKKKCSGQTVRKTISHKPTSSIFISIERRQTINLLSFPPVAAHVQMAALAGDFYLDKTVELSRKKNNSYTEFKALEQDEHICQDFELRFCFTVCEKFSIVS